MRCVCRRSCGMGCWSGCMGMRSRGMVHMRFGCLVLDFGWMGSCGMIGMRFGCVVLDFG